jgi:hypothetical protein
MKPLNPGETLIERVEALEAECSRLQAQLPSEMQDCTILFVECEKGHGRLTAKNWVGRDCHWCAIEKLKEALKPFAAIPLWRDTYPDARLDSLAAYQMMGYVKVADVRAAREAIIKK